MKSVTIPILTLAVAALAAPGCGVPMQGASHFEGEVEPERHRTFAWDEGEDAELGDERVVENPFFEDRLHAAIERELLWRGIRYDETAPDLRVHHHTTVEDHVLIREVMGEEVYAATQVTEELREGLVLVHMVDVESGEDIWLGWARGDIEAAFASPAAMTRWVDDLVATMFTGWPGLGR